MLQHVGSVGVLDVGVELLYVVLVSDQLIYVAMNSKTQRRMYVCLPPLS